MRALPFVASLICIAPALAPGCSTTSASGGEPSTTDVTDASDPGKGDMGGTDSGDDSGSGGDSSAPGSPDSDSGTPADVGSLGDASRGSASPDSAAPVDDAAGDDAAAPVDATGNDTPAAGDTAAPGDAPGPPDTTTAPGGSGTVELLDPLDEPAHYCVTAPADAPGGQSGSPVSAATCAGAADQVFVANDPGPGQLRMPASNLCLESQGVYSSATVSLKPCSKTVMQMFELREDLRIQVHAVNQGLCLAVAPGAGKPLGGAGGLQRTLDLQDCDTVPAALSQWSVPGGDLIPPDIAAACTDIKASLDAILASNASCSGTADCTLFEWPICGSAGCYQEATGSLEAVPDEAWDLANEASLLYCDPFHCGCGYETAAVCLDGTCRKCPGPGCQLDCDALVALLVQEVHASSACDTAQQCVALPTPLCTVPGLGCYQAAVSFAGSWGLVPTLIQMVADQGCALADCDCQDQGVDCVAGHCESVP